jgi:hypothetical protein
MFRFIIYAFMACVAAFAGVSWAVRGFPMPGKEASGTVPIDAKSLQMTLAAAFDGRSAKDYERKQWEAQHSARGDDDAKLNRIRMEALQTADAYAMAPCGEFTKLNLVAALTAYTRAWQERMDCPRLMNLPVCGDKKQQEMAATFSTPLDLRVQTALANALQQGGIMRADFPAEVRGDLTQFPGPMLWFGESPVCGNRQRAPSRASR